jgi:hypothetical protein
MKLYVFSNIFCLSGFSKELVEGKTHQSADRNRVNPAKTVREQLVLEQLSRQSSGVI